MWRGCWARHGLSCLCFLCRLPAVRARHLRGATGSLAVRGLPRGNPHDRNDLQHRSVLSICSLLRCCVAHHTGPVPGRAGQRSVQALRSWKAAGRERTTGSNLMLVSAASSALLHLLSLRSCPAMRCANSDLRFGAVTGMHAVRRWLVRQRDRPGAVLPLVSPSQRVLRVQPRSQRDLACLIPYAISFRSPVGTFSRKNATHGAAACMPCPPGQFGDTPRLSTCKLCPAGEYQVRIPRCSPLFASFLRHQRMWIVSRVASPSGI